MKKIVTVIGARPQFIKASVVSRAASASGISEVLIHTGQHFDRNMSDVFFDEMDIPRPKYNLGIGGGTHGQNTGRMVESIEEVLINENPSMVLVYGDTDSTLAGALAASKLNIPIAHIEAGLRSYNRSMPEEINRVLTDHISSLLFAPTQRAVDNLLKEGIGSPSVIMTGDVMYDAALFYAKRASEVSKIMVTLSLQSSNYVLATLHRAQNTDDPTRLVRILNGLAQSDLPVILPLHPRTKNALEKYKISIPKNTTIIEPVGYLDMIMLEKNAAVIATDSGGVQKEAYFYNVPCIIIRDETEWVELVNYNYNALVGANEDKIAAAIATAVTKNPPRKLQSTAFYGDGDAASKIIKAMIDA